MCTGNKVTATYIFTSAIQYAHVFMIPAHISNIFILRRISVCVCVCVYTSSACIHFTVHAKLQLCIVCILPRHWGYQWNSLRALITIMPLFKRDIAMLKCTEQSKPLCGHVYNYRPTHQTWVWWEQHSGWSHSAHQSMPDHSCTASKQRVSK